MQADYDSAANAISMAIADARRADASDEVHPRAIVALADRIVTLEVAQREPA